MRKIAEYFVKIAGLKNFSVALVLYLVYAVGVMGWGANHISELSGTKTEILDLQMTGYDVQRVNDLLSVYTPAARNFYVKFSLIADSGYPLVYTFLYIVLIAWVIKATGNTHLLDKKIHLLPLLTLVLDFIENMNIAALVSNFPEQTELQVQTASMFTMLKWGSLGLQSLVLLAVLTQLLLYKLFSANGK